MARPAGGGSELPSTESELVELVRQQGPEVLAELFSERAKLAYEQCVRDSGTDPSRVDLSDEDVIQKCSEAGQDFVDKWSQRLLELAGIADGPRIAEIKIPDASCLQSQGLLVDSDSLDGLYPSAPAIAAVHAEHEAAEITRELRAALGQELQSTGTKFLGETENLRTGSAASTAIAPIRARVEVWVDQLAKDPLGIDDQGWAAVAVDAQAVSESVDSATAEALRTLAGSIQAATSSSQQEILDKSDAVEAKSEAIALKAVDACGGLPQPGNPTTEQTIGWLEDNPDVVDMLVGS